MAEPHVVTALRAKRAEISGHVADLERKLARHRASLANIDAAIRLFAPELDPDSTPSKRTYPVLWRKRHRIGLLTFAPNTGNFTETAFSQRYLRPVAAEIQSHADKFPAQGNGGVLLERTQFRFLTTEEKSFTGNLTQDYGQPD
jgi:hypothetical protein